MIIKASSTQVKRSPRYLCERQLKFPRLKRNRTCLLQFQCDETYTKFFCFVFILSKLSSCVSYFSKVNASFNKQIQALVLFLNKLCKLSLSVSGFCLFTPLYCQFVYSFQFSSCAGCGIWHRPVVLSRFPSNKKFLHICHFRFSLQLLGHFLYLK